MSKNNREQLEQNGDFADMRNEQKSEEKSKESQLEQIKETGQITLAKNDRDYRIELITIIGEIEGHECLSSNSKTTKYEHMLPKLAAIQDSKDVDGVLILINSCGGDVSSGLAIAEMIASLSKPTVSLVVGDSHSISVPLAVSTDYSFIVPSATMVIHPVRSSGLFIGVLQTYLNMEKIQDRIIKFIAAHSKITEDRIKELMLDTKQMVKDVGTMLEGEEAVKEGVIDEIGGIREAMDKLYSMIKAENN